MTHNTERTAVWNLKPERWGSPLFEDKNQEEKAYDKRQNNNNNNNNNNNTPLRATVVQWHNGDDANNPTENLSSGM